MVAVAAGTACRQGAAAGLLRHPPAIAWRRQCKGSRCDHGRAGKAPMTARQWIAGVDEAGRGPLAGPVAVAAVVLDPLRPIHGLNDSKKLSRRRREALYTQITQSALAWPLVKN